MLEVQRLAGPADSELVLEQMLGLVPVLAPEQLVLVLVALLELSCSSVPVRRSL